MQHSYTYVINRSIGQERTINSRVIHHNFGHKITEIDLNEECHQSSHTCSCVCIETDSNFSIYY